MDVVVMPVHIQSNNQFNLFLQSKSECAKDLPNMSKHVEQICLYKVPLVSCVLSMDDVLSIEEYSVTYNGNKCSCSQRTKINVSLKSMIHRVFSSLSNLFPICWSSVKICWLTSIWTLQSSLPDELAC